jgi:enolase-phosphatase E1
LTPKLGEHVSGVLLDVEGTTTPIDFVFKILFPYALAHAEQFLKRNITIPEVRSDLEGLRQQNLEDARQGLGSPPLRNDTPEAEIQSTVAYMEWLTARDRKTPPFKFLQGRIWQEGYRSGQLRAQVFDDVPRSLKRWHEEGKKIAIFSGGSVLAQKLLFANTVAGDLAAYLSGYFDTTTGAKADPVSYTKIAEACQLDASEMLFVSDVVAELDAAQSANMRTLLSLRPGNRPQPANSYKTITSFDQIFS